MNDTDFKIGDIVKSHNPFCTYKVVKVYKTNLWVIHADKKLLKDFPETFKCKKRIFQKV